MKPQTNRLTPKWEVWMEVLLFGFMLCYYTCIIRKSILWGYTKNIFDGAYTKYLTGNWKQLYDEDCKKLKAISIFEAAVADKLEKLVKAHVDRCIRTRGMTETNFTKLNQTQTCNSKLLNS